MNYKTVYIIEMKIHGRWWVVSELDGLNNAINAFRQSVLADNEGDYRLTTKTVPV